MKRLGLTIVCLVFCLSPSVGADSGDNAVSSAVVLSRTRFLSTEKAAATLSISNGTSQTIAFWPSRITLLERVGSQWEKPAVPHERLQPDGRLATCEDRAILAVRDATQPSPLHRLFRSVQSGHRRQVFGACRRRDKAVPSYAAALRICA